MWSWNNWSKQDKIDIERMAFNVERTCSGPECNAPLPKHCDLDQHKCEPCREAEQPT